jgi:zinc transport system substrate-binding protein
MRFKSLLILSYSLLFFTSDSIYAKDYNNGSDPLVVTSINPIYQIALAIIQDKSHVNLLINPASSEHNYSLKKHDLDLFLKADLIFYVSDNLESNFPKLIKKFHQESNSYELIKTANLKLLTRRNDDQKNDIHIWLNPDNAILIAKLIADRMSILDSQNAKKYQINFKNFQQELSQATRSISKKLTKIKGKNYIFYHDGYQYFEDYFSIKPMMIIAYEHNQELRPSDLQKISELTKTNNVQCIFGEPQEEQNSALKLAHNFNLKFSILDLIGSKENYNKKNGYVILLQNMANDLVNCL